ncbi:hypothetical protein ACULNC_17275 [Shigella flexneri]
MGDATHPRYGMGNVLVRRCGQMGAVCHRVVLRPVSAGWIWRHGAAYYLNAYLTTQRKAWMFSAISARRCAVCRYGTGKTLTFVQDRPSDKAWTDNRSNVVMPGTTACCSATASAPRRTAIMSLR